MDIRLPSISRKTISQTLDDLNPVLLVPLMSNFSRAVNDSVSSSRAVAAALQAASAARLQGLLVAAPRVRAALDKLTVRLPHVRLNVEEVAIIRAVIGYYIALILQLLNRDRCQHRRRRNTRPCVRRRDVLPHYLFILVCRAHHTRIGVLLPPILS